ncbi:hypothetical protein FB45DRAFT_170161 [Roridomyces roridus]|uniref:Uncharacterized protein n=1 Tax=Roridomyces roridus TaxID=1738132 RepID=A0AAD7FE69_9AGAR|nr:hypothetical protein FB45DRAFT_170161 [Roridomyces roridus]
MSEDRPIGSSIPAQVHSVGDEVPPQPTIGALFSHNRDFVIQGGNFTNINYPSKPPNFREIPMGDLILSHEIPGASDSMLIVRRHNRKLPNYVRRIYSAEIVGLQSPMTARVIEGPGAEEQWRKEIALYSNLRNPYVLQLYGIGHSGGVHALVFHDDLVPWRRFRDQYPDPSHFSRVYFYACLETQLRSGRQYISSISDGELSSANYTVWIRLSKGVLHMELKPPESKATILGLLTSDYPYDHGPSSFSSFLTPPQTSVIMNSLSLDLHLSICSWHLGGYDWFTVPTNLPIQLGSIYHVPTRQLDVAFQIAVLPAVQPSEYGWCQENPYAQHYSRWITEDKDNGISILDNGWIRVDSGSVWDRYCHETHIAWSKAQEAWLAQAAHIFSVLDIHLNLDQYVFSPAFRCCVDLVGSLENLPTGYLLLCPEGTFTVDRRGHYTIPDCPAYWSLDPSGAARLMAEEASKLGFPDLQLELKTAGACWSEDLYTAVCQFYAAKGYGPEGLDVARELGYPIFELACTKQELHAHLQAFGLHEESDEDHFKDADEQDAEEVVSTWSWKRMVRSLRSKMRLAKITPRKQMGKENAFGQCSSN